MNFSFLTYGYDSFNITPSAWNHERSQNHDVLFPNIVTSIWAQSSLPLLFTVPKRFDPFDLPEI